VKYDLGIRKLSIGLFDGELESLARCARLEGLILCGAAEVHERSVVLKYDENKRSKFVSVIDNEDGYLIALGPLNYVALCSGKVVEGQFAKGSLEFDAEVGKNS